ncbi:MAG: aminodeoxychorismate/anthranilate synthase component II [Acidobacteria bacterium]|nr:aminodeoxychorismate/anthranilate synthase component II [Acidobacteriota bacterium]MCB9398338.1 aminodeoxychorismate/anthranilate synthase component II [Acidobacteriota bacterium]
MILFLDNYDSFSYNLVQILGGLDDIEVVHNDTIQIHEVLARLDDLVVIGPGPGRPSQAGICVDLIRHWPPDRKLFGVCLGLQAMVEAFGGRVIHAPSLVHGKTSAISHNGKGVFRGMPEGFQATRYHSLCADRASLPQQFEVTAETKDGVIMGIRSRTHQMEAVQFHPESHATDAGHQLLANARYGILGCGA